MSNENDRPSKQKGTVTYEYEQQMKDYLDRIEAKMAAENAAYEKEHATGGKTPVMVDRPKPEPDKFHEASVSDWQREASIEERSDLRKLSDVLKEKEDIAAKVEDKTQLAHAKEKEAIAALKANEMEKGREALREARRLEAELDRAKDRLKELEREEQVIEQRTERKHEPSHG